MTFGVLLEDGTGRVLLEDGGVLLREDSGAGVQPSRRPGSARIQIRRSRKARDVLFGTPYLIEERTTSGKITKKGKARTRRGAFEKARKTVRPQTSPTAAAGAIYVPGGTIPYDWQFYANLNYIF